MRLVLVGAGHSHLEVACRCEQFRKQGIEVVLVSPGPFWYSGLATGVLGGQYPPEEDQLDPERLMHACGGEFVRDKMQAIDTETQVVELESGSTLAYNALSLNIGSEVHLDGIPGAAKHCCTVKPIANLWRLRQALEKRFQKGEATKAIVIGGGPTGCEIAANLVSLAERHRANCEVQLVARDERLLSKSSPAISRKAETVLEQKGISILKSTLVNQVLEGQVETTAGTCRADFMIAATGLTAPAILKGEEEGLKVNSFLQSIHHPAVFGAGDCISLAGHNLPKLGVFGVREAPVLASNLLAYLQGRPLKEYHPQTNYLSILNWGDGKALAIREPFFWHGRLSYWLKDYLDRSFLSRYRQFYQ